MLQVTCIPFRRVFVKERKICIPTEEAVALIKKVCPGVGLSLNLLGRKAFLKAAIR